MGVKPSRRCARCSPLRAIEFIEEQLAKREAGANAKVIEGEAEVVPSLSAPGSGGTKMPKA